MDIPKPKFIRSSIKTIGMDSGRGWTWMKSCLIRPPGNSVLHPPPIFSALPMHCTLYRVSRTPQNLLCRHPPAHSGQIFRHQGAECDQVRRDERVAHLIGISKKRRIRRSNAGGRSASGTPGRLRFGNKNGTRGWCLVDQPTITRWIVRRVKNHPLQRSRNSRGTRWGE